MFVRWKRKQRKEIYLGDRQQVDWAEYSIPVYVPDWLRTAVLVESVRIDGKPRQRTIKYLGSIREWALDPKHKASIFRQGDFWRDVDARLDDLNLSEADRARIVATLEETVPRPDPEKHRKAQRKLDLEMARLRAMLR